MPEDLEAFVRRNELSRRRALQLLFGAGAVVAGSGLLAACSSGNTTSPTSSLDTGSGGLATGGATSAGATSAGATSAGATSAGATSGGATSGGATSGTASQIASLTWGNGSFDGLDPATAASNFASTAAAPALETLIGFDSDLKIIPILAESYTKPDTTHLVYKIRTGVNFWDGTPMTADDVAFSMSRHMDPKLASQLAGFFTNVKSITATGPAEVTVELASPDPLVEYASALVPIFPKTFVAAQGAKLGTPAGDTITVMGTGPMKITKYDDSGVTYEPWTGYWGKKSLIQKMNLDSFTSSDSARLAYQSGKLGGTFYGITGDTLSAWQSVANAKLQASSAMNVGYLSLNMSMEPFSDIHARKALAYAADTQGFLKAFLGQAGQAPNSIVPPAYFGNLADQAATDAIYAKIPQYEFDLDKAKAELAQSKYPNGFTVEVPYTPQFPISGEVLVSMSQTLKAIGITFTPKSMPIGTWAATHQANASPILWGYWLPDFPDPSDIVSLFFPSSGAVPHRNNKAHWKDPEVDALLKKQAETTDVSVRVDSLGQLLQMAGDQMPYLPLWFERAVMAADGGQLAYTGFSPMFYVNDWTSNIRSAK